MIRVKSTSSVQIRMGQPRLSAQQKGEIFPDIEFEVEAEVVGDVHEENDVRSDKWYRDKNGDFMWAGGFERIDDQPAPTQGTVSPAQPPVVELPQPAAPPPPISRWWLRDYGISEIWQESTGKGVKVAILDSGVDLNHPDLQHALGAADRTKDCVNPGASMTDTVGHGTHSAGLVAAKGEITTGVAPDCSLFIGKVTQNGLPKRPAFLTGLEWAINQNVDIISMSLMFSDGDPEMKRLITAAHSKGIVCIGAAGNQGRVPGLKNRYPAHYPGCVSIGACKQDGSRWIKSNRSNSLDLLAPGEELFSTYNKGGYNSETGTSQATAYMAGVFALLKGYALERGIPIDSQKLVELVLEKASIAPSQEKTEYGSGVVRPKEAFNALEMVR